MCSPFIFSAGRNHRVNGFALILTNDYLESEGRLQHLRGAFLDGKTMLETMKMLNFETHWEHNATAAATMRLVREASSIQYLPNYKRLVFVFSGHGTAEHCLYSQDGKHVNLEDVMKQFFPGQSPHLGTIPKLFFIDACRGSRQPQSILVTKGAHDVTLKVPEQSNFLVAYSTMPEYRAYELSGQGGVWMNILAKKLKTTKASILDVLTAVNTELCLHFHPETGCFQQPEFVSRLNEEVNLLCEAERKLGLECFESSASTSEQQISFPKCTEEVDAIPELLPKHFPTRHESLIAHNIYNYSMCTTAKEKVAIFCAEKKKPEPRYKHLLEDCMYRAMVYVAKTCGRVTGDSKSNIQDAEESAAAILAQKLHIY